MSPVMSNRRLAYSRQQLGHLHNSDARVGCYHNQLLWTRKSEWLTEKEFHCSVFIFQGNFIANLIMLIYHHVLHVLSHTGPSLGASCVYKETIKFWGQIILRNMFLYKIKLVPLLLYSNHKILPCVWCFCIKAGLVLHDFILCFCFNAPWKFTSLFKFMHNFWCNVIRHRQSVSALIFCRRLRESDFTVMPSVTCMDWLRWWYDHVAYSVSSATALAFLANMNEKCKSTSPRAIQVKIQWKTIGIEEKFEKGEQIIGICIKLDSLVVANIQFLIMLIELKKVLSGEITLNANNLKQWVLVCVARLLQFRGNELYRKLWVWISYIFIALEINK